jgi:hypothetical protein
MSELPKTCAEARALGFAFSSSFGYSGEPDYSVILCHADGRRLLFKWLSPHCEDAIVTAFS